MAADKAALAAILDGQGKYDEAEALYRQALAVFERVYGPDHYELAVTFNNLAALSHAKGDDAEAEQLYRRPWPSRRRSLGPDHPDVAMTLNNLAVLYKSAGKYSEAEPLYQRALAIFEAALGPTHPKVITCRQELCAVVARDAASGQSSGPREPPQASSHPARSAVPRRNRGQIPRLIAASWIRGELRMKEPRKDHSHHPFDRRCLKIALVEGADHLTTLGCLNARWASAKSTFRSRASSTARMISPRLSISIPGADTREMMTCAMAVMEYR